MQIQLFCWPVPPLRAVNPRNGARARADLICLHRSKTSERLSLNFCRAHDGGEMVEPARSVTDNRKPAGGGALEFIDRRVREPVSSRLGRPVSAHLAQPPAALPPAMALTQTMGRPSEALGQFFSPCGPPDSMKESRPSGSLSSCFHFSSRARSPCSAHNFFILSR